MKATIVTDATTNSRAATVGNSGTEGVGFRLTLTFASGDADAALGVDGGEYDAGEVEEAGIEAAGEDWAVCVGAGDGNDVEDDVGVGEGAETAVTVIVSTKKSLAPPC